MWRIMGAMSCFVVALNSVRIAVGEVPDTIFPSHLTWLWWLIAVGWTIWAAKFASGSVT